jgi:hypothetical protein
VWKGETLAALTGATDQTEAQTSQDGQTERTNHAKTSTDARDEGATIAAA